MGSTVKAICAASAKGADYAPAMKAVQANAGAVDSMDAMTAEAAVDAAAMKVMLL